MSLCAHCEQELTRRKRVGLSKAKFCSVACSRAYARTGNTTDRSSAQYYRVFEELRAKACDGDAEAAKVLRDDFHTTMVWDKVRKREVYT